jgi:mRNA-degrading endonuclease RelE of RelBE toxin-antitoxin system
VSPRGQSHIELSRRASRDLKSISPHQRKRVVRHLTRLRASPPLANLDVKPIAGHAPWLRLRAGAFRILYRRLTPAELEMLARRRGGLDAETGFYVGRIVDRSELERAVDTLELSEP